MRILFDLNVLLDVACRWEDFPDSLARYERAVVDPIIEGAFAACGYTTLFYVMKQLISAERARLVLANYRTRLQLLPFNERIAAAAHKMQLHDFEDACIAATAYEGRCDIIGTRNVADFKMSPIPAATPEEILTKL